MFKFIDKETKGQSLTHTYPADLWQGLEQSTHTLTSILHVSQMQCLLI